MNETETKEEVLEETEAAPEETAEEAAEEEVSPEETESGLGKLFKSKLKKQLEEKEAEIQRLNEEIEKLQGNVADLRNAYAKAYADAENTKKRLNNEFELKNKYRIQNFATEILPVIDNCERALALEVKDETDANYRKGFEMVYKQLMSALAREGVEEIEALNQPFDANWHQALMAETVEGVEPGTVTCVLQKGYKLKDRILRAAMVKISE